MTIVREETTIQLVNFRDANVPTLVIDEHAIVEVAKRLQQGVVVNGGKENKVEQCHVASPSNLASNLGLDTLTDINLSIDQMFNKDGS